VRAVTDEPADRMHEMGTESARVMLFLILPDRILIEDRRTTDEARDIDRLIAG
jgi:hypothetical protein